MKDMQANEKINEDWFEKIPNEYIPKDIERGKYSSLYSEEDELE